MKKTLLAFLVVGMSAMPVAHAQIFRPTVVQGAILGGAAGAVIGHNSGRHAGEGAVIGALAGALLGTACDRTDSPRTVVYAQPPAVCPPPEVVYAPPPVYCPPPVTTQVVYVQPAQVYAAPVYYCPPRPRVVVYGYQPAPVVVYQNYGYGCPDRRFDAYGRHGRGFGDGRWR